MTAISQQKLLGIALALSFVIFLALKTLFENYFQTENHFYNAAIITMLTFPVFLSLEEMLKSYVRASVAKSNIAPFISTYQIDMNEEIRLETLYAKESKNIDALLQLMQERITQQCFRLEKQNEILIKNKNNIKFWGKIISDDLQAEQVLSMSSSAERNVLKEILCSPSCEPDSLISALKRAGTHEVTLLISEANSYREIVKDAANKVGTTSLSAARIKSSARLEREIITTTFQQALDNMSPEERNKVLKEVEKVAEEHGQSFTGISTTATAVFLAQSSGFGIYLLSSTLVGALTHVVGVTLPFAFYTTMSSTISILIGPIGWTAMALWGVYKVGSVNYKKTIPCIIMIGHLRSQIAINKEVEIKKSQDAIAGIELQILKLQTEMDELKARDQVTQNAKETITNKHQPGLDIARKKAKLSGDRLDQVKTKFMKSATFLERIMYSLMSYKHWGVSFN